MTSEPETDEQRAPTDDANEGGDAGQKKDSIGLDRDDEDQDFVDQSKIDFDPDEGLYTGTAVEGGSEIPGPHLDDEGEMEELDDGEIEEGKEIKEKHEKENAERAENQGDSSNQADEDSGE